MTRKLTMIFQEMSGSISRVFSGKEAGCPGDNDTCVMMIEEKEGYYFLDDHKMLTCPVDDLKRHRMKATHGYLPTLAYGNGVRLRTVPESDIGKWLHFFLSSSGRLLQQNPPTVP